MADRLVENSSKLESPIIENEAGRLRAGRAVKNLTQKTVAKPVVLEGVGLHSGEKATVTIAPAKPNSGIYFVRSDHNSSSKIMALVSNVRETQLATTLSNGHSTVSTVEHLLAALAGYGIDNARIEVSGPELPIMDGSSVVFCEAIQKCGIEPQFFSRQILKIRQRVELRVDEKWGVVEPSEHLVIQASIDWDHPTIGYQEFRFDESRNHFDEIADSRTFGFLRDVEALQKMGLARGGSLDNCIVLDQDGVVNEAGLRYPDEFVRHKVLDALGDFKLAGCDLQGSFRLHRSGHEFHRRLLAAILSDEANYEIIETEMPSVSPYVLSGEGEALAV